jgi:hypothetical protein
MLIALLALLGVDLITLVVLLAFVLSRKRWVKRQPGAFAGAIRVVGGKVDGLKPKWRRGFGRWVRDVFVWTKGPVLTKDLRRDEITLVVGRLRARTEEQFELAGLAQTIEPEHFYPTVHAAVHAFARSESAQA